MNTFRKTREILNKYGLTAKKKFGQNFLIDDNILDEISTSACINDDELIIEIGPGLGNLTSYLLKKSRYVLLVEIDNNMIEILNDRFKENTNYSLINEDILKVDLDEKISKIEEELNFSFKKVKVVANLPYYITTPIIMGLFENHVPVESITVMVQKEVADRMQTGPGSKDYGALSLAVQYYAEPYIVANVPPNCFMPRPKVGSAVIRLTRHKEPPVEVKDEKLMFDIIRASFNQRRKTLANGLNNSDKITCSKEIITEAIEKLGKGPSVRGEALSLQEFASLSNDIFERDM